MLRLAKQPRKPARPVLPTHLTEAEYVKWAMAEELHKAEWKDGEVLYMAPANGEHIDIGLWLATVMKIYCEEYDLGLVRLNDFMVRFATQKTRRLPDVLFVDKSRLHLVHPNHLEGAPDLAVEVVSPDSGSRDRRDKYLEYEKAGVREYWIVDPNVQRVEAYALKSRKFVSIPEEKGVIRSIVLPKFFIKTDWLWKRPLPNVLKVIRELGIKP